MLEIQDILDRIWTNITQRPDGPLALRFYLQPTIAAILAIRDGMKDARSGQTPYFWAIVFRPEQRRERLREGLKAVAKVMVIAVILDAIYQWKVLGTFYPGEAVLVAFLLAYIPYLLIRGPVARIAHYFMSKKGAAGKA